MLLCCGLARSNATTYYVDYVGGVDWNAGTSTKIPWQHCPGDPAATAVPGTIALLPGDMVQFKGGVSYILSGSTGILLNWDGAGGKSITYDGNSSGKWGSGRAIFTDNHGANGIVAFSSNAFRRELEFTYLEFAGIGGAATLPVDPGSPSPPRFGGGMKFGGGAENVTINACVFRDLGYWFNQRPMSAASIVGVGIAVSAGQKVVITNCQFSCVAVGCDFSSGGEFSGTTVKQCTFADTIVWPISLPGGVGAITTTITAKDSSFAAGTNFGGSAWAGYGEDPRTEVVSVKSGSPVTLTASALASPAPVFEWRRNGVPINATSGNTLLLSKVDQSDAAVYTAVATNEAGSATSNTVKLMVDGIAPGGATPDNPKTHGEASVAPAITVQPISQTAVAGATVTFGAAASGSPTPSYQWTKNGAPIWGATGSALSLTGITGADAGQYAVVVTNTVGSVVSNAAFLAVNTNTAPLFTAHPIDHVVVAGSNVVFTASASGSPAPNYQWTKNGASISGATGSTLTLVGVTAADAGKYAVLATNTAGSILSSEAALVVNTNIAPTFIVQPLDTVAAAQTNVVFTASASGTPSPVYQWFKNGSPIGGAAAASLTLFNVTGDDAGSYMVMAKNLAGAVTSAPAQLTVNVAAVTAAPIITLQPTSQTAMAVNLVIFHAAAIGTPVPSYQWLKNGSPMAGATSDVLTIQAGHEDNGARFSLVATNSAGSVTSEEAILNIASDVPFETISVMAQVASGGGTSSVDFTVGGSGPKTVLVRAIGPSLGRFAKGALTDPVAEIYQGSSLLYQNDNWDGSSALIAALNAVGAFPFASVDSKDAALLVSLAPGTYRVLVSSGNGDAGNVLVEIYEVP